MEEILGIFICGLLGLISLGASIFFWKRINRFLSGSLPAEGEVVVFRESHGDGTTYAPIVRFQTPSKTIVEFTDSVYSNPPGFEVGERIKIFHHRRDFNDARIAKTTRLYFLPGFFLLIGTMLLGISVVIVAFKTF